MTIWQQVGFAVGLPIYALAGVLGGRAERTGAAVLIIACMADTLIFRWQIAGLHLPMLAADTLRLIVFGWMCLRFDRWWPLLATAAMALMVLVQAARVLDPAITQYAVASAGVGLGYLIDLALLLGVVERWVAGEPAAGRDAWTKAARVTAARQARRDERRWLEFGAP